jgi:hypothetical protein
MHSPWDFPDFDDHEIVHFVTDRESGLKAIIAVIPPISARARAAPGCGIIRTVARRSAMCSACRAA